MSNENTTEQAQEATPEKQEAPPASKRVSSRVLVALPTPRRKPEPAPAAPEPAPEPTTPTVIDSALEIEALKMEVTVVINGRLKPIMRRTFSNVVDFGMTAGARGRLLETLDVFMNGIKETMTVNLNAVLDPPKAAKKTKAQQGPIVEAELVNGPLPPFVTTDRPETPVNPIHTPSELNGD